MEFQACRDDNEIDIPHRRASDTTAADVNPVVVRQRLISPSLQQSTYGKGDQGVTGQNMTKTVYGAVKGALQVETDFGHHYHLSLQKLLELLDREETNINHHPNYRGSQDNTTFRTKGPLPSRPKKHSRLSSPKRREDSDDSTSMIVQRSMILKPTLMI